MKGYFEMNAQYFCRFRNEDAKTQFAKTLEELKAQRDELKAECEKKQYLAKTFNDIRAVCGLLSSVYRQISDGEPVRGSMLNDIMSYKIGERMMLYVVCEREINPDKMYVCSVKDDDAAQHVMDMLETIITETPSAIQPTREQQKVLQHNALLYFNLNRLLYCVSKQPIPGWFLLTIAHGDTKEALDYIEWEPRTCAEAV